MLKGESDFVRDLPKERIKVLENPSAKQEWITLGHSWQK